MTQIPASPTAASTNLRDLGGTPITSQYRVRRGLVFRSEAPSALPDLERASLKAGGITLVCDLRSAEERERASCSWPDPPAVEVLVEARPERNAAVGRLSLALDSLDGDPVEGVREFMLEQYAALPFALSGILRSFFERLVAGRVPVLLHCAAGKDRTGFASAMLLIALGADMRVVEEDYLLSNRRVDVARIRSIVEANTGHRISFHTAAALTCRPEYLQVALEAATASCKSIDGYLEDELGLGAESRRRLRRLLLEPIA